MEINPYEYRVYYDLNKDLNLPQHFTIERQQNELNNLLARFKRWFENKDKELLEFIYDINKAIDEEYGKNYLTDEQRKDVLKKENAVNLNDYKAILCEQNSVKDQVLKMIEKPNFLPDKVEIEKIKTASTLKLYFITSRTDFLNAQFEFIKNLRILEQAFLHKIIYFSSDEYMAYAREYLITDVISKVKTMFDYHIYNPDKYLQDIVKKILYGDNITYDDLEEMLDPIDVEPKKE